MCRETIADAMKIGRARNAPETLIVVQHDDEIGNLIDRLGRLHILGAPVMKDGRVVGMIEMRDIVTFIIGQAADPTKIERRDLQSMTLQGRGLSKTPVVELIGLPGSKGSMALPIDEKVFAATQLFEKAVHRVSVYDAKTHEVKGIFSQSDFTRYMIDKLTKEPSLKSMAARTLKEYGYTGKAFKVETISTEDTVLKAVQKMAVTGVSALAVVDPQTGVLRGNFSSSDLRGVILEHMPHLLQTVFDYLTIHSPSSLQPVVEPAETRSLLDTAKSMVVEHVHRVWLLDDNKRPISVISMTDLAHIAMTSTVQA